MIKKEIRDEIVAQALKEISFARTYKQGKVKNWQKNEDMYYGKKAVATESRANVDLGRMQEFVHTLQSKMNKDQVFKFTKRKEAQLKRVKRLNALRDIDQDNDNWKMKLLVGGKQIAIYGREIYSYYADSVNRQYMPHLANVDVYDFLIDPSAGGIDIEKGMYMGDYGVVLERHELEEGIKGKDRTYLLNETKLLLDGVGNNTETPQEETNKQNRTYGQGTQSQKHLQNNDKFKFWRWYTTYKGERYYLLLQERAGTAIRVEKLTDLFTPNKYFPKGAFPYFSAAAFPDLTEFWTPSYCDYVREIYQIQNVNVNQMLDNAEEINKPQRVVNVNAIEDLAALKYRRESYIKVKGDFDANRVIQELRPNSIQTPLMVFDKLEAIQEKASGVTAGAKGASDEDGKVAIYEGNQQEVAGRFDLLDRSRSFAMNRFGRLYEIGVRDHLTKKVAVDMIGPEGVETEEISKRDIFRKSDDFGLKVESANSETAANMQKQAVKVRFIDAELANPAMAKVINPKKAFELKARIVGVTPEEVKELMDTSEFGNAELMSEAERDLEKLLDDEDIVPNAAANNAYKQRMVNYLIDHEEDISDEQFQRISNYIRSLDPIIARNEARALNAHAIKTLDNLEQQVPENGTVPAEPNPVMEPTDEQIQI